MSQKITSKNLQYTAQLPPFLARLRGQHAAETDPNAPDPILAARRQPGKPRSGSAEAEDAPLVVDEHGNAVDVTVGADGSVKEKDPASAAEVPTQLEGLEDSGDAAQGEKLAGIGEQRKKRKIGKIIGADSDDEDDEENAKDQKKEGSKHINGTSAQDGREKDDLAIAAARTKVKKKAKKIKLSFGEDEG
ncbi:hypothetical protein N657DRAFT_658591 [Parathielavia appendiculata]|uniref:DUF4604 domain-containing protein n=1 Tax=Parathielavia appendiculata TaxID=2587402 RepID=A0AAN6Z0A9_9PEZI|nr:hypothetical protein N657DRAFT_658591 [Parathielavia appendiculata]